MSDMSSKKDKSLVGISPDGQVDSRRFHLFADCSFLKDRTADDIATVTDREIKLLGLKVCAVCERRKTGGPVIEALKEVLHDLTSEPGAPTTEAWDEEAAWKVMSALKNRGFYIAQRQRKNS